MVLVAAGWDGWLMDGWLRDGCLRDGWIERMDVLDTTGLKHLIT